MQAAYKVHTQAAIGRFKPHEVSRSLYASSRQALADVQSGLDYRQASVILFLVGDYASDRGQRPEPCLVLNKRSARVRQPGDLCCPGGGVTPALDRPASALLKLPGSPLRRWSYWARLKQVDANDRLPLLMATAFREGLEEMRLNPLGLEFLGLLPTQDLVLFNRRIFPLVCRVKWQRRFFPNWEVAKIVPIPLRHLLDADRYAQYRLTIDIPAPDRAAPEIKIMPCFLHHYPEGGREIFWGATLRMALQFLELVYGFIPPQLTRLPVVPGRLTPEYLTGTRG